MATENKLAMLNLAAACLGPEEIYLEVGAWTGCSILGASMGHGSSRFVTIDNFSEFGGPVEECRGNLAAFSADNVELVDADFVDVLGRVDLGAPVGVYFYDGAHSFSDQLRALRLVEPLLAEEALVIIDDTSHPRVAAANRLFVQRRPQFELVLRFSSSFSGEPLWWNGVEAYVYRRALGPGSGPPVMLLLAGYVHWWVRDALERGVTGLRRRVRCVIDSLPVPSRLK